MHRSRFVYTRLHRLTASHSLMRQGKITVQEMKSSCISYRHNMGIEIFYILLFFVALLYSSVGHGGASGYLALMTIYGISATVTKPTALLLNLFVSLTSFIQFNRGGFFRKEIFI